MRNALNQIYPEALAWDEAFYRIITDRFMIAIDGRVNVEFKNGV